jgi:hypothetical protein
MSSFYSPPRPLYIEIADAAALVTAFVEQRLARRDRCSGPVQPNTNYGAANRCWLALALGALSARLPTKSIFFSASSWMFSRLV